MFTYRFNRLNSKHEVLNPNGYVILSSRLKYVALQRAQIENDAVYMRKSHENRVR